MPTTEGDIWVFGFGSLMWEQGFEHIEARPALVHGYHRALCVLSHRYRGTPECPGLVLGLDRGGSCKGHAFRVAGEQAGGVLDYLHEREMVTGVYAPRFLGARLDDGRRVEAYAFIVDRGHRQYAGKLSLSRAAQLILQGHGPNGSSLEYLENTVTHLDRLGIRDGAMHKVLETVEEMGGSPP